MPRLARVDAALALAFLIAVPALAIYQQRPPSVVPLTAPDGAFSAERAMLHVRAIAAKPHPMKSAESAKVRAYLEVELRMLAIEPQTLDSVYPGQTLMATIPGTRPGKALMLCAHYDSHPEGPGAGDDAAGVAAILETLRALRAGPPLANDLVVLFTDGEEIGLCGARAFVENPDRRERVGLVLNFEGRGSRGPSYMFETSERNGWLIREFARAAPYPTATSLAGAVYREMPNSTDLTAFKGMNMKGLNFAFVDGYENYHQATDTPENLDPRSLQHHGSYALALARHFGGLELDRAGSEPDAVYFPVMGPHLVVYPEAFVAPLTALAMIGFGFALMFGLRRKRLTERELIRGAGVGLLAVGAAAIAAWFAWQVIRIGRPMTPKGQGTPEIAVALTVLGLVAAVGVYAIFWRRVAAIELVMGGLFWWLILAVAATVRLPGGSYLFVWPALFGLLGIASRVIATDARSIAARAVDYLAALPALVLLPPTLQSLCVALGPNLPFAAAPVAALMVLALVPILGKLTPICSRSS